LPLLLLSFFTMLQIVLALLAPFLFLPSSGSQPEDYSVRFRKKQKEILEHFEATGLLPHQKVIAENSDWQIIENTPARRPLPVGVLQARGAVVRSNYEGSARKGVFNPED
jgi:hypothetical protein